MTTRPSLVPTFAPLALFVLCSSGCPPEQGLLLPPEPTDLVPSWDPPGELAETPFDPDALPELDHPDQPAGDDDYEPEPPSFDDPPDVGNPPLLMQSECDGHDVLVLARTLGVTSWNDPSDSDTLIAPDAGWYWLYDLYLSESGASQWNETASLRIANGSNPSGRPLHTNCGDDWIVKDTDNNGTPALPRIYMGLFWLDAGANTVTLEHACPKIRAGSCTSYHDLGASSTCQSSNPNSAHLDGQAICAVRVDPGDVGGVDPTHGG